MDPKAILAAAEARAAHLVVPRPRPPLSSPQGPLQQAAERLTRIVVPGARPKPHTARMLRGEVGRIQRRAVAGALRRFAQDAREAETAAHLDLADTMDTAAERIEAGLS